MINGRMAEAQNGFAVLETVDEGTMERFIEWLYKGYYTPADFHRDPNVTSPPASSGKEVWKVSGDPSAEATHQEIPVEEVRREEVPPEQVPTWGEPIMDEELPSGFSWGQIAQGKKSKKPKTKKELKKNFLLRQYKFHPGKITIPRIRANQEAHEDYTEVFLSHARLHVFADMYDIPALKSLAFEELHDTLSKFTLYRPRTGDIIALLRYVYANTSPERDQDGDDLRTLLTEYIGYEMSALMKAEKFNEVMIEEGGALLGDFMKMVALRIH